MVCNKHFKFYRMTPDSVNPPKQVLFIVTVVKGSLQVCAQMYCVSMHSSQFASVMSDGFSSVSLYGFFAVRPVRARLLPV